MPHNKKEHENENPVVPEAAEVPETSAAEAAPANTPADSPDVRVAELEAELAEASNRHLRLMAEYDNYRKRTTREREGLYKDAQAKTLEAFLTVADNFDRAMAAATTDPDFKKGMELIHTGFTETLGRFGVTKFGEPGEPFNPEMHAAVAHVEDSEQETGTIAQVYSPGYKMEDKVLRPATVVVAN